MLTHFAPFLSADSSAPTLCGNEGPHDAICNVLPATTCTECKAAYEKMRVRAAQQKDFLMPKLTGLLNSYQSGFLTMEEYFSEVTKHVLVAVAQYGSNDYATINRVLNSGE